jgi:hypothetical protein
MKGFDAAFFFLCFLRSARASGDFVLAGASRHGGGPFANNGLAESHSITPWPREKRIRTEPIKHVPSEWMIFR